MCIRDSHPKQPTSIKNNKQSQQSAVRCLHRHQQVMIVPPPPSPPPWQHSPIVRRWCHSSGPKIRKWHQQHRGL
eukprot:15070798-Ditylum_brightwellii.AAC.1